MALFRRACFSSSAASALLAGKKGVVVGLANDKSIAFGCAKALHKMGAEVIGTYASEKAAPYVLPLASELGETTTLTKCDVRVAGDGEDLKKLIERKFGKIDFFVHSIAFAPLADLHGRLIDSSQEGFLMAMDISCHSFVRYCKLLEPLVNDGGSLATLTYLGSEKAVDHYNLMGPVKAALESSVRYLALELGGRQIRVNAISPGPILTRAASGLKDFEKILKVAADKSPQHHLINLEDIGNMSAFLASDLSKSITGDVHYVDAGYHIVAGA